MKLASLLFVLTVIAGCATIIGDENQSVSISSTPSNATVVITDETGRDVFEGKTPTTVNLQKSDGSYWGGKSFTVKVKKDGFVEQSIPVEARANGWYIGGNILFGGLIGWFIVDPLNGGMYTLSPDQVSAEMSESVAHNNKSEDGISIVLLEDVPESLRDELVAIN